MGIFDNIGAFVFGGLQVLAGVFAIATGAGGAVGLKLIVSGGLSILSGIIAPTGQDGYDTSPRYGFDNANNSAHEGQPIPVIYGRDRIAPKLVSATVEGADTNQKMKLLYVIGEGEIESFDDLYLNDTPISAFPGVVSTTRLGASGQTAIPGFGEIGTIYDSRTELNQNVYHVHETRKDVDAVQFNLVFPRGVFGVSARDGGYRDTYVIVQVDYKAKGAPDSTYKGVYGHKGYTPVTGFFYVTPWVTGWVGGGWVGGYSIPHPFQRHQVYRQPLRVNFPVRGEYEVRIKGLLASTPLQTITPVVEGVVEIVNDSRAYDDTAVIALEIPATEQLSGGIPHLVGRVDGIKCYDFRTMTTGWTRNPVLAVYDLLTNGRYGLGGWVNATDIDVAGTWTTEADKCDDIVTGFGLESGHVRNQIDTILDSKAPARDWISQILATCRLTMFQADGLVKLRRDEESASVRTFSENEGDGKRKSILATWDPDAGIRTSSLVVRELPDSQRWNVVKAKFVNRDEDYEQQTIQAYDWLLSITGAVGTFDAGEEFTVVDVSNKLVAKGWIVGYLDSSTLRIVPDPDMNPASWGALSKISSLVPPTGSGATATLLSSSPAADNGPPKRELAVSAYGVTRPEQALRIARYHLNLARTSKLYVSFGVFLGDLDLEPHDVFEIDSDRLGWSGKLFTTLSVTINQDGTGRIHAREYDPTIFLDSLTLPPPAEAPVPLSVKPVGVATNNDVDDKDSAKGSIRRKKKTKEQLVPKAAKGSAGFSATRLWLLGLAGKVTGNEEGKEGDR